MFESPSGLQHGPVPAPPPKRTAVTGDGRSTRPGVTMEGQPGRPRRPLLRAWHRQRCGDRVSGLPPICGRSSMVEPRSSKPKTRDRYPPPAPTCFPLPARRPAFQADKAGSAPASRANLMRTPREAISPLKAGVLGSTPRSAAIVQIGT